MEKEALKTQKIFTAKQEYFGIPSKLFWNIAIVSVLGAVLIREWWFFWIGSGVTTLIVMYNIHKDDPYALTVWKRGLLNFVDYFCAGYGKKTKIIIYKSKN